MNVMPTPVNKDVGVTRLPIGNICQKDIGIVNNRLTGRIRQEIIRLKLNPLAILEQLRRVLALYLGKKVAMRWMKSG